MNHRPTTQQDAPASAVLASVLATSGLTKSALCQRAGLSRSLLDAYLKGHSVPSVDQVARILAAAGYDLDLIARPKPKPVPEAFVAVLEFGDLFPRKEPEEPVNLGPVWRNRAARLSA